MKQVVVYTDGGARNNPGPAGIGVVVFDESETKILSQKKEYIGQTTNNQAEYKAVLLGLKTAKELKATHVEVRLDSELVASQLSGIFKLKNPDFQDSFIKIHNLKIGFDKVNFIHIPREKNHLADKLVNQAIDEYQQNN